MHTRTMSRRNRAAVAAGLLAATTAVVLGQQALASAPPHTAPAGSETASGSARDPAPAGSEASPGSAAAAPSGSEATQATLDIGSVPADFSIVYVPGLTGNPFYNTVACGAQARADELGIDFTYQGAPEFDVAKQSAIVSALVGQKPNAIMISVTDPDAMIPPLQEAKDAGIEVIGTDGELSDTSIMGTNTQSDNLVGGPLAAHSLVEAVGEDV